MQLMESFSEEQRTVFRAAAERLELARGEYLLRRGEPGGDVFLLEQGALEVVDSRVTPEVIVANVPEGNLVGEMAFIDDSPRSADVRAGLDSVVLRWARDDLSKLLQQQPEIGSLFYQTVCREASLRVRRLTEGAVMGGFQRSEQVTQEGLQRLREETRALAEHVKSRFLEVETALRTNTEDTQALDQVKSLLDQLQGQVHDLFVDHPEPEAGDAAAEILSRELHPYLVRSALAERCIRRPQGVTGTAEILAHVLVDTAGGDGQLGEILDRWLLDRPSLKALRTFRQPTIELVVSRLPEHRNRRVLLINAGTGSLAAGLSKRLAGTPTVLTVVDQSRDALAFLGASGLAINQGVEIQTVQENLAQLAMGRVRHKLPAQDAIVIHGLLEYMPERIAVSLVQQAAAMLHDDGTLVCSALAPSDDRELLDRLLAWPTIRRPPEALERVIRAGGMHVVANIELPSPGLLVAASPGLDPVPA